MHQDDRGLRVRLSPPTVQHLCDLLGRDTERLSRAGRPRVVLVSPEIRAGLKQLTLARLPDLVVLSYDEITPDTRVESVRIVNDALPVAA